jgi:hypothetical protein
LRELFAAFVSPKSSKNQKLFFKQTRALKAAIFSKSREASSEQLPELFQEALLEKLQLPQQGQGFLSNRPILFYTTKTLLINANVYM